MQSKIEIPTSGTIELFQGEVLGEVIFDKLLSHFKKPDEQYKLATLLQLETETKARLRVYMHSLDMDLQEDDEWRQRGVDMAATFEGKSWQFLMQSLNEVLVSFVARYHEIASEIPKQHAEIHRSMVIHEVSLLRFTEQELAGNGSHSLDDVIAQLKYPLEKPS